MIGKTISHYKILSELGRGGMGVVYKAEDTKLERFVAIKVLPAHLTMDKAANTRFIREAKAASALEHPNICNIYEIDETDDGYLFMVMPCYEGETLGDRLERGPLGISEALDIAAQLASALSRAHEKGIVHRDIKPGNIMLTDGGRQAKLMDFGLSKRQDVTRMTRTGMTVGTVAYMSPEQALGNETNHRTDIWSLGVVLYEMLTGKLPFRGEVEAALFYSIVNEEPELITDQRKDVPVRVESLIEKALAKDVDKRHQSMDELLSDLQQISDRLTLGIRERRFINLARLRRRRRIVYGAAAVIVIAAVLIVSRLIYKESMALDSIAVLPLKNLSGDPDLEFLADGITADMITGLSRLSGFEKVISRATMMQFKGTKRSLKDIAADLDIEVLIAGTVQPAGSSVKIGLELIRADTGENLWTETYEESLGDIQALINNVTRTVAGAVAVGLTSEEAVRLTSARSVDPEAYEAYLRGRAFVEMWYDEGFDKSFEYLGQAIEKQPDYAPAYAELVNSYADAHRYGYLVYEEAYPLAEQAITMALELDFESVESQVALGMFRFVFEWDWKGADEAFRHALELDPRNAITHRQYGNFLVHMGQRDESIAELERARELAPLSIYINQNLGWAYYHARRYDEALSQLDRTKALLEQFPDPHKERQLDRQLLWCYIVKGMHEESFIKLEELGDWVESDAWDRVWTYVAAGRRDEISGMIDTLLLDDDRTDAYYRSTGVHPWTLAILGETDRAIEFLESVYENHAFHVLFMPISPEYDNIRSDPRFQAILDRLGLPWQQ